jgi:methionine synthase II (cobalamin-independent)
MFATLAGAYPRTPLPGRPFRLRVAQAKFDLGALDGRSHDQAPQDPMELREAQDDLVREVIAEQENAGLELLTDGNVRWDSPVAAVASHLEGFEFGSLTRWFATNLYFRQPRALREPRWTGPIFVDEWRFARDCTDLPVKQSIIGPYTLARMTERGPISRERLTIALADALALELQALVDAGCQMIQIDENAATMIGIDRNERELFKAAHRRLTYRVKAPHLCLAITMGSAHAAGPSTIFDAPYHSYLFDVVTAPQNWALIGELPTDRGVICGVVDARSSRPDDAGYLRWSAQYAAAAARRGPDRVGLATAGGMDQLPRDRARAKIDLLGMTAIELSSRASDGMLITDIEQLARDGLNRGWFGRVILETDPPEPASVVRVVPMPMPAPAEAPSVETPTPDAAAGDAPASAPETETETVVAAEPAVETTSSGEAAASDEAPA